jgi:YD repeat-containing protein
MINSFAPNGLLERKRCLTDDGGFDAEERRDYDANGCRVSIRYHDAEGRLTTMSGVARLQYAVDDLCEDVRITRYDATGRLVGRVAIRELQRDALGRVVHERCWAPGKKPTNCGGGDTEDGSTMTMAYDDYDRMVSRKCHDIAGSPTSCGVGKAFEERIEWDARGREIARSYFGVDGKPALDLGAARVVSTYDSVGVVHDRRFFGTQGEPVRPTTGCHQIVYVRDAHHQLASVECRDTLGVLTAGHLCYGEACLGGAARVVVERPTFSHLVNVHFDADGKELERVDCDLHACFR